jgi:dienelactone hydrolase
MQRPNRSPTVTTRAASAICGMVFRDETMPGMRPGVQLVHGGGGLDEHARQQARRYATHGYIVLACDMLGDGVAGDRDRVIKCLTGLRDKGGRCKHEASTAGGPHGGCPP